MLSVLLVDDEYDTLLSWQAMCDAQGYYTLVASDGKAALDVLRGGAVDVVVADSKMPEMSGCELCYHMRQNPGLAEVVFILVSAAPSPPAFLYYDAFLRKPLAASELTVEIDRIVVERNLHGRSKAARVAGLRS